MSGHLQIMKIVASYTRASLDCRLGLGHATTHSLFFFASLVPLTAQGGTWCVLIACNQLLMSYVLLQNSTRTKVYMSLAMERRTTIKVYVFSHVA
jgi:hypothetical protein